MNIGEKIKAFRNIRGISQHTLGELSGINEVTIRKYELGSRNPKPDQLLKIANALGISINIFLDYDIETISDILSLIFKMDEQLDITFDGKKDEKGKIDPKTLTLHFNNVLISKYLSDWAYFRGLLNKTIKAENEFESHEAYITEVKEMQKSCEEIKQRLMCNRMIVKKDTPEQSIKIPDLEAN